MFTQCYFLFHVEKAVGVSEFSPLQRRTDRMALCREGNEPLGTFGGLMGRLCTQGEMQLCLLHWRQPGPALEGPVLQENYSFPALFLLLIFHDLYIQDNRM